MELGALLINDTRKWHKLSYTLRYEATVIQATSIMVEDIKIKIVRLPNVNSAFPPPPLILPAASLTLHSTRKSERIYNGLVDKFVPNAVDTHRLVFFPAMRTYRQVYNTGLHQPCFELKKTPKRIVVST